MERRGGRARKRRNSFVVPQEVIYNRWARKVKKLQSLLATLDSQESIQGKAWVEKMKAHYGNQLKALMEAEPKKR